MQAEALSIRPSDSTSQVGEFESQVPLLINLITKGAQSPLEHGYGVCMDTILSSVMLQGPRMTRSQ